MRTYPILLWVFLSHFLSGAMAAERPNVLMIAIDDLNDWLGCYQGHPQAVTPHIDGLAERGIRFTNAHCAAPVCKASRSAIFSGRAPVQTAIFGNSSPDVRKQLGDGALLPAQFAKAGYTTFGTGKLLHGSAPRLFDHDYTTEQRWSPFSKEEVAYSQSDLPTKGTERPRHVIKDGPEGREWVLPLNGLRSERNPTKTAGESFDWGPVDVADQFMGDARITDWAMEQLEAIVEAMESEKLPLDDLVKKYEEGTKLLKICQSRITAAQEKIQLIAAEAGGDEFELTAFEAGAEGEESASDRGESDEIQLL